MKRVCPTCKTTKFRQTSDSGLVCKYGHKILGVQAEQQEDDMVAVSGRQRKRVKVLHDEHYEARPAQQKSDFLRIVQLSLQVFSRSMIQDLNFPPELEPALRELWILYLADSKTQITEAYLFEAKVKEEEASSKTHHKVETFEDDVDFVLNKDAGFSDSSSSEDDDDQTPIRTQGSTRCKWPDLIFADTLVFIYLACIYLNYPILINDLLRWSNTRQLPYLSMQGRIPSDVLGKLRLGLSESMTMLPSFTPLLERTYTFSRCFTVNCKLTFPPINIPLYLERFCSQFFLPGKLKRDDITSCAPYSPFFFSVEGYYYADYIFQLYRQKHHLDVSNAFSFKLQPTTILMACVVAAAKLIYGVEEFDITHVSQHDTTTTKQAWVERIRKNVAHWQNIKEDHHELDRIIQYLQDTSFATKASVHNRDRPSKLIYIALFELSAKCLCFPRCHSQCSE
jgi:hypothetical protein